MIAWRRVQHSAAGCARTHLATALQRRLPREAHPWDRYRAMLDPSALPRPGRQMAQPNHEVLRGTSEGRVRPPREWRRPRLQRGRGRREQVRIVREEARGGILVVLEDSSEESVASLSQFAPHPTPTKHVLYRRAQAVNRSLALPSTRAASGAPHGTLQLCKR
eukprot:scaffold137695_cov27-Tisochrysis_lutea.AAC.6